MSTKMTNIEYICLHITLNFRHFFIPFFMGQSFIVFSSQKVYTKRRLHFFTWLATFWWRRSILFTYAALQLFAPERMGVPYQYSDVRDRQGPVITAPRSRIRSLYPYYFRQFLGIASHRKVWKDRSHTNTVTLNEHCSENCLSKTAGRTNQGSRGVLLCACLKTHSKGRGGLNE